MVEWKQVRDCINGMRPRWEAHQKEKHLTAIQEHEIIEFLLHIDKLKFQAGQTWLKQTVQKITGVEVLSKR